MDEDTNMTSDSGVDIQESDITSENTAEQENESMENPQQDETAPGEEENGNGDEETTGGCC
jgi:hypothetical protein